MNQSGIKYMVNWPLTNVEAIILSQTDTIFSLKTLTNFAFFFKFVHMGFRIFSIYVIIYCLFDKPAFYIISLVFNPLNDLLLCCCLAPVWVKVAVKSESMYFRVIEASSARRESPLSLSLPANTADKASVCCSGSLWWSIPRSQWGNEWVQRQNMPSQLRTPEPDNPPSPH